LCLIISLFLIWGFGKYTVPQIIQRPNIRPARVGRRSETLATRSGLNLRKEEGKEEGERDAGTRREQDGHMVSKQSEKIEEHRERLSHILFLDEEQSKNRIAVFFVSNAK
jgi:hypothetical protein